MKLREEVDKILQAAAEPIDSSSHAMSNWALGAVTAERIEGGALLAALGATVLAWPSTAADASGRTVPARHICGRSSRHCATADMTRRRAGRSLPSWPECSPTISGNQQAPNLALPMASRQSRRREPRLRAIPFLSVVECHVGPMALPVSAAAWPRVR